MPSPFRPETAGALVAEAGGLIADVARFGRGRLGLAVALMIAGGVLEGVGLALLVPVFSLILPEMGGRWQAIVTERLERLGLDERTEQLAAVLLVFLVLIAVRAAVLTARDRISHDLTLGYADHCRLKVVTGLAYARWSALAKLHHARIGHVLSSEIGRLDVACAVLLQMAASGIMLAVQAALMVALSPVVAGLAVGFALLGLVVLVPLSRRAAAVGKRISRYQFRIAGEAAHFLGGLKLAVAHDQADAFVDRMEAESAALRAERDRQQRFQSRVAIASASAASLVGAGMILGAVLLGVAVVPLLAGLMVLARMSGPVRTLQMDAQQLFGVLPAFGVIAALHDELFAAARAEGTRVRAAPRGAIRFEGVGFRYPDASTPVFADLDLRIEAGETVGLSGPSGTGKTTFVDLLTGLLDPTAGRIVIGEGEAGAGGAEPLGPETLADWRRRLAYVAQDSFLTNDTVRQNLVWDAPRPDAELWQALAQAGAADLVAAMPDGLDTVAGERGSRLSGGERQRVALARAILRAPELLILDEATNAIDVATERAVIARLRRTLPHATILVIAHREETLAACDRVIALAPAAEPTCRPVGTVTAERQAPAGTIPA